MAQEIGETMSDLKPEEENCVQLHVGGMSMHESFRKIWPKRAARWTDKTVYETSSRFFSSDKIVARLVELSKQAQEATGFTAEYVLRESGESYEKLRATGDLGVAKGYLELVGKHKLVKAFDNSLQLDDARVDHLSVDELEAKRARLQARIDEQA